MMEVLKLPQTCQESLLLITFPPRKEVGGSKAPEGAEGCSVPDPGLSHSPELDESPLSALGYVSHRLVDTQGS